MSSNHYKKMYCYISLKHFLQFLLNNLVLLILSETVVCEFGLSVSVFEPKIAQIYKDWHEIFFYLYFNEGHNTKFTI